MGTNDYWKGFGYSTGAIETRYSSFLVVSNAYPGMGWRMCVELIFGCAQPYGWKITSVKTNVEQFLSGGGSEGGHRRSLWPQHLAPYRSGVVWFTLRSIWPVQLVTETQSSHIRMVTVIQSVCPSTEIKFGKHLRCFEVGSVVFSGKCGAYGISLLFSCAKGPAWYHCLWFGGRALHWVMSTFQLLLNLLRGTRQYGFPPQQLNDGSGSGMSNRWWQVMFTVYFACGCDL